jgi:hypothetical protein
MFELNVLVSLACGGFSDEILDEPEGKSEDSDKENADGSFGSEKSGEEKLVARERV